MGPYCNTQHCVTHAQTAASLGNSLALAEFHEKGSCVRMPAGDAKRNATTPLCLFCLLSWRVCKCVHEQSTGECIPSNTFLPCRLRHWWINILGVFLYWFMFLLWFSLFWFHLLWSSMFWSSLSLPPSTLMQKLIPFPRLWMHISFQ